MDSLLIPSYLFYSVDDKSQYGIRLITASDDIGGGRVEVYHNGEWGTICDKNWSEEAAELVCRELGYRTALFPAKKAYFGEGSGKVI